MSRALARLLLAGTILSAVAHRPAAAQEDPRLSAIEAQIRALQSELARVRRDLASRDAEARAARQEAARARAEQEKATQAQA